MTGCYTYAHRSSFQVGDKVRLESSAGDITIPFLSNTDDSVQVAGVWRIIGKVKKSDSTGMIVEVGEMRVHHPLPNTVYGDFLSFGKYRGALDEGRALKRAFISQERIDSHQLAATHQRLAIVRTVGLLAVSIVADDLLLVKLAYP
jgi:hypothetical protein